MELYQETNKNAIAILDGEEVQAAPTGRRSRSQKAETANSEQALADDVKCIEQEEAENAEMNGGLAQEIEPNTGEPLTPPVEEAPKVRTRRKRGE